jgi:hypothetical protein
MARSKDSQAIIDFHRAALKRMLQFVTERGITNLKALNAVNGRKLLDEPLWKLLETEGKYGGPLISEGVRAIEEQLSRKVSASSGTWPEAALQSWLGQPPDGGAWSAHPSYCCHLEHVIERAYMIQLLLAEPDRADEILDTALIGCVVLRAEHPRLASKEFDLADPWKRYRRAGIKVWTRTQNDWIE